MSGSRQFTIDRDSPEMTYIYKIENGGGYSQINYDLNSEIIFDNINKIMYVDDEAYNYSDLFVTDDVDLTAGRAYLFINNIVSVSNWPA